MTGAEIELLPPPRPRPNPVAVESEVVGMVIFVFTEVMFFAAFLSAYNIIGARSLPGEWPPPYDPALPVATTALASVLLLLSGGAVFLAGRAGEAAGALRWLWVATGLAAGFVGWQVVEAITMFRKGLTLVSSAHGGFFYTIVGAHALHAVVAVVILLWSIQRLRKQRLSNALFQAIRIFWYFVVGLWPVLYGVVYL